MAETLISQVSFVVRWTSTRVSTVGKKTIYHQIISISYKPRDCTHSFNQTSDRVTFRVVTHVRPPRRTLEFRHRTMACCAAYGALPTYERLLPLTAGTNSANLIMWHIMAFISRTIMVLFLLTPVVDAKDVVLLVVWLLVFFLARALYIQEIWEAYMCINTPSAWRWGYLDPKECFTRRHALDIQLVFWEMSNHD